MKSYSVVVFDWDGTLMDSTHSIVAAIQAACRDLDLPVPSTSEASWVIGLSLESALRRAVPDLTAALMPRFLERYRIHYLTRDPELRLFEGIPGLLDDLAERRIRLAVATGKSRVGLNRVLGTTGLAPRFEITRCADESFSKPHPAMLKEIMEELDVPPEQMLMVGDTSHDLQMAVNAGVDGLGVTYGAHRPQDLLACAPQGVVDDVAGLRGWLLSRVAAIA